MQVKIRLTLGSRYFECLYKKPHSLLDVTWDGKERSVSFAKIKLAIAVYHLREK